MTSYNPEYHHRRSIRLIGYDYSQAGLYFITICCHGRECWFGEIKNGVMILNDAGNIANECWSDIPTHFPNVVLHEFIIMPNHIHGVIELKEPSKTIGSIVRGFKIGVTKWMRQNTNVFNVWQRNYWEHIIRNENEYNRIAQYILSNPQNWEHDQLTNIK